MSQPRGRQPSQREAESITPPDNLAGKRAGFACTVRIVADAIRRHRRPGPLRPYAGRLTDGLSRELGPVQDALWRNPKSPALNAVAFCRCIK